MRLTTELYYVVPTESEQPNTIARVEPITARTSPANRMPLILRRRGENTPPVTSGVRSVGGSPTGPPILSGSRRVGNPRSRCCSGNVLYDLKARGELDDGGGDSEYAGGGWDINGSVSENDPSLRRDETGGTGDMEWLPLVLGDTYGGDDAN